jgi:SAM-dependent methyltransferase
MPKATLIKSKERVKKYGEVFTPEHIVKDMCDLLPKEAWHFNKIFLEPACGDGNFLVEIVRRKLETCKTECDVIHSLMSTYGIDILADNIDKARERVLEIVKPYIQHSCEKAKYVAETNIMVGDFLKDVYLMDWETMQKVRFAQKTLF